jgi:hypothetical protein
LRLEAADYAFGSNPPYGLRPTDPAGGLVVFSRTML